MPKATSIHTRKRTKVALSDEEEDDCEVRDHPRDRTKNTYDQDVEVLIRIAEGGFISDSAIPLPDPDSIRPHRYATSPTPNQQAVPNITPFDTPSLADIANDVSTVESFLAPDVHDPSSQREPHQNSYASNTPFAVRGNGTNGQGWVRSAANDYLLGNEQKGLLAGKVDDCAKCWLEDHSGIPLSTTEKRRIQQFQRDTLSSWIPSTNLTTGRTAVMRYSLANAYIFSELVWMPWLFHAYSKETNSNESVNGEEDVDRSAASLLDKMQGVHRLATSQIVFNSAIRYFTSLKSTECPRGLWNALESSGTMRKALDAAVNIGKVASKGATWIRVEKIPDRELKQLRGKGIVETADLLALGLQTGAFTDDEVLLLDETWHRIERPPRNSGKLHAVYLWEPEGPDDYEAVMSKVVGGCIYGLHALTKLTTDFQLEHERDTHATIIESLMNVPAIKRTSMFDAGSSVKLPLGVQQTNGQLQSGLRASDLKKGVLDHTQFKLAYSDRRDTSQALNFRVLEGFMPHFAKEQLDICRASGLLNRFGTPNYQCFGSWGYYAGLHLDNDDGASCATVTERTEEVVPDSSNFIYGDYKIILELAANSNWFWHANRTWHGTTLSYPPCQNPGKWKQYVRSPKLRAAGQITMAHVILKKAVSAASRSTIYQ